MINADLPFADMTSSPACLPWSPWIRTHKGDERARDLADRHYTRQSPGHPMFTRPGYNFVLFFARDDVRACFVWWRPKWEAGQERGDGLRAIECTIFRREGPRDAWPIASVLVGAAIDALKMPAALDDLAGCVAPPPWADHGRRHQADAPPSQQVETRGRVLPRGRLRRLRSQERPRRCLAAVRRGMT